MLALLGNSARVAQKWLLMRNRILMGLWLLRLTVNILVSSRLTIYFFPFTVERSVKN